jgi:hypothetical protein
VDRGWPYHATVTLPGGTTKDVALGTEGLDRLRIGLGQDRDTRHDKRPLLEIAQAG